MPTWRVRDAYEDADTRWYVEVDVYETPLASEPFLVDEFLFAPPRIYPPVYDDAGRVFRTDEHMWVLQWTETEDGWVALAPEVPLLRMTPAEWVRDHIATNVRRLIDEGQSGDRRGGLVTERRRKIEYARTMTPQIQADLLDLWGQL